MERTPFTALLEKNTYPGRGIMIGRSADGKHAVTAYFIMGRSVNSRNRVFVEEGEGIRTEAFDVSKLSDPSLIIYELMGQGKTFEEALRTRKFEPDEPNYTPRISGIINVMEGGFDFAMSILKSGDGDPEYCIRNTFAYDGCPAGEGRFVHTYTGDGNPLPSYEGEPARVEISGDIDQFTDAVWNSLNEDNKVSLFVRYIDIETGEYETRIVNKNK